MGITGVFQIVSKIFHLRLIYLNHFWRPEEGQLSSGKKKKISAESETHDFVFQESHCLRWEEKLHTLRNHCNYLLLFHIMEPTINRP